MNADDEPEAMGGEDILRLSADVVASYVSKNSVSADDASRADPFRARRAARSWPPGAAAAPGREAEAGRADQPVGAAKTTSSAWRTVSG